MGAQESIQRHNFSPDQVKRLKSNYENMKQDLILGVVAPKSFETYLAAANDLFELRTHDFQRCYSLKFPRDKSTHLISKLILNWNSKFSQQVIKYISQTNLSIQEFHQILSQNRLVKEVFMNNLRQAFFREEEILLTIKDSSLKFDQIWILRQLIQQKDGWELLYSTAKHGKNWTLFLEKVLLPQSCLIIIQDLDDFVFGVYVDESFSINPKFHGNSHNFMFTLEPKVDFYYSTGLNSNYQYINTGTQSLPNGVGFGGQLNYFGLFLDSNLCGRCDAEPRSTTFNNPILSCKREFQVKSIEIISILQKQIIDEDLEESILNKDHEAAFLEISGKKLYTRS